MSVLEKFLSYIKISSPSDEECENCPSSACQLDVAEFVAQQMKEIGLSDVRIEKGYVYGTLSAYDGFMRNFDIRENVSYAYNLIAQYAGNAYDVGRYEYVGKNSIVFLRSFKTNELDMNYYRYEDGTQRHAYVDANDGLCKNSLDTLIAYSDDATCAEVLLSVMPVYISDAFEQEKLISLSENGIYSIWFDGTLLRHSEETAIFKELYDDGKTKFSAEFTK